MYYIVDSTHHWFLSIILETCRLQWVLHFCYKSCHGLKAACFPISRTLTLILFWTLSPWNWERGCVPTYQLHWQDRVYDWLCIWALYHISPGESPWDWEAGGAGTWLFSSARRGDLGAGCSGRLITWWCRPCSCLYLPLAHQGTHAVKSKFV